MQDLTPIAHSAGRTDQFGGARHPALADRGAARVDDVVGPPGGERPDQDARQLFQSKAMRLPESPSHARSSGSDHRLPLLLATCMRSIWNAA